MLHGLYLFNPIVIHRNCGQDIPFIQRFLAILLNLQGG